MSYSEACEEIECRTAALQKTLNGLPIPVGADPDAFQAATSDLIIECMVLESRIKSRLGQFYQITETKR